MRLPVYHNKKLIGYYEIYKSYDVYEFVVSKKEIENALFDIIGTTKAFHMKEIEKKYPGKNILGVVESNDSGNKKVRYYLADPHSWRFISVNDEESNLI